MSDFVPDLQRRTLDADAPLSASERALLNRCSVELTAFLAGQRVTRNTLQVGVVIAGAHLKGRPVRSSDLSLPHARVLPTGGEWRNPLKPDGSGHGIPT